MKPLNRLSVKWVLFLLLCLKAIKHGTCKKILLQYIVCAGKLGNMSCCLVRQQSRLMFMLVISITGIFVTCQILNPIPLYGFDCGWFMRVSSHCQKTGVHSSARWLCMFAPFIISDCGNHFLVAAISLSYWGSRLSSNVMSTSWSDFITIKITVSANII